MLTVGLAHDLFISSAAVVREGKVVAAIAEERLNRRKAFKGFPAGALRECLRIAGADLGDVDAIAIGWNPGRHLEHPNRRWSNSSRWRPEYLYAIPNMLMGDFGLPSGNWIEQRLDGLKAEIVYYDHHLAHAANAFYLSGFDHAAVCSVDGRGERDTVYWGKADSSGIQKKGEVVFPHSLGLVYGTITQYLGFTPDSDEWKVMALASYGESNSAHYDRLKAMIEVDPRTGRFFVDQRYFVYHEPECYGGRFYSPDFVSLFGPPRERSGTLERRHMDIASALQRVFEETMTTLLNAIHAESGEDRLVAAGGCLMNSVYNGKITRVTPFKETFVSSCPDDSGISVGAALLAYHRKTGSPRRPEHPHNYWGPEYTNEEIVKTLEAYKLQGQRLSDAPTTAAGLLAEGRLLGWFQGAMEFGQRALGNRSILMDPRRADGRDVINRAVKYREAFRPFAPAILAESAHRYFNLEETDRVPFMERVCQFREDVKHAVPSVVHVDGSGRLQTVVREHNPRFYDLIKEFERLTGVPIVLNTSFNLNGEPIVCTPTDAIRTFFSCGLDCLVMGDFLLEKRPA